MTHPTRREFLRTSAMLGAAMAAGPALGRSLVAADKQGPKMRIGAVTYLWGKDWDLPTLITNLEKAQVYGVELRTQHKHGVEPSLSAVERAEVKKRFADSPVEYVGPGTNQCYDSPDPAKLKDQIEGTKAFVKLSHDCGGTGVKVKPNDIHTKDGIPIEKTTAQIAAALNEVGAFAADYGQEIRVEVHGSCSPLPIMKQIADGLEVPNVGLCWNSNSQDIQGDGLAANFNLVKGRLAHTTHIREINRGTYPYQELFDLMVGMDYEGWVLLECRTSPPDLVAAYAEQRELFAAMVARAQAAYH